MKSHIRAGDFRRSIFDLLRTVSFSRAIPILLVAGLSALPATSSAQPITYSFSGVGSGSLGASTFSNANFSFAMVGNVSDVVSSPFTLCGVPFAAGINVITNLTAQFSISGVVSGTFGGVYVWTRPGIPILGFGNCARSDLLDGGYTGMNYDLKSSFGPQSAVIQDVSQFNNVTTSIGTLSYSAVSALTFRADVSTVPEPSTYALLSLGLVVVGVAARGRNGMSIKKGTNNQ